MIILKKVADLVRQLEAYRAAGQSTGFVPTMGALHQGHLSLLQAAKGQADRTICSIFVNPTQFNDPEDFQKYPITTDQDIALLLDQQVDILFLPTTEQLYPEDLPKKSYDLGSIESVLEGAHRPGHFQGVAQVIDRLVSIIQPAYMIMGQKDFQQVMVISKLLKLMSSNTILITSPTLRESSGLAKSSRNARLTDQQQLQATAIYQALLFGKSHILDTPARELEQQMTDQLLEAGFSKVDYVAICHPNDLTPIDKLSSQTEAVILIAAFLGEVRLIDNMVVLPTNA